MEQKACVCAEPMSAQSIITGYHGNLLCKKCGGIFAWPLPEKKYEGDDKVEELLFNLNRNKNGLTIETAILTMLLRIEEALKAKR